MSDDDPDVCGAETASGEPCQHPTTDDGDPDRCWVDGHNDAHLGNDPGGRPTAYDDETARAAIDAVDEQKTKSGVERAIGIGQGTLDGWLKKDLEFVDSDGERRDFSKAFRQARARVQADLVNGPLWNEEDARREMDGQHARFLLSSSYGLKKTEKREMTGEDGGPIEHDVPAEFVTYQADDGDE